MRAFLAIPILILAGLAVYVFTLPDTPPQASAVLSGATPGIRAAQAYVLPVANPYIPPVRKAEVPDPILDASVALLMNPDSGQVLLERNANVSVPIASLTKLMTAFAVADLFDGGEVVTVSSASVRVDGMKQTLSLGERITVRDLLTMMLIESSNDAAYALNAYAQEQGIDLVSRMNAIAHELDMTACIFTNPAGLDDAASCTAYDLARLVRVMMRRAPRLVSTLGMEHATVYSVDGAISHVVTTTNELFGAVPGLVGGKTGNTDGALGCLLLIVNMPPKGDTLISVVLGSRARFQDTETLFRWAGEAYQWQE